MKDILNLALLQLAPCDTPEENLRRGAAACRKARALGADLALFPEMWSIGYVIAARPAARWLAQAVPAHGPFPQGFAALAKELQMAIAVTFLEQCAHGARNTLALFDRFGAQRLLYAKVHTCDFGAERALARGEDFYTAALDTACGPVQVGAMICYDREFPESARLLMLKGAELILVPNACPLGVNRLAQLRARAFENMLAVATCNYPASVPGCNGCSTVFDGVAYAPEGCAAPGEVDAAGERDMCILRAGGEEGIYLARLNLARLRAYRQSEVHGNAYRRPQVYAPLAGEAVLPPFVRPDRRP